MHLDRRVVDQNPLSRNLLASQRAAQILSRAVLAGRHHHTTAAGWLEEKIDVVASQQLPHGTHQATLVTSSN